MHQTQFEEELPLENRDIQCGSLKDETKFGTDV